jgi:sporulation protein YabP
MVHGEWFPHRLPPTQESLENRLHPVLFPSSPAYTLSNTTQQQEEQAMQEHAPHTLILENRKQLSLSGVTDVDSFDEREIILYTKLGELTITGKDLHINAVNIENGNMTVEGDIWSVQYGDRDKQNPLTLLGRLFR